MAIMKRLWFAIEPVREFFSLLFMVIAGLTVPLWLPLFFVWLMGVVIVDRWREYQVEAKP